MIIALKKVMENAGISAPELSEKTGLTKTQIWNYQSGRNDPDPEALCLMADALNCSLDMLIRGKEKDRSEERSMETAVKRLEQYSLAELKEMSALAQYLLYRKEREQVEGQGSADKQ